MANTTERGIIYPTSGDNIAPLETHFAALAESTDTAITDTFSNINAYSITTGTLAISRGGTGATTAGSAASSLNLLTADSTVAGKNKLLNGNFDVSQRSLAANANSGYFTDRWYAVTNNRLTLTTPVTSNQSYARIFYSATGTSASISIMQALESKDVNTLQGKTVTFSFKIRRNAALVQNLLAYIESGDTADVVSTGTWTMLSGTVIQYGSIPTDTTWKSVSVTTTVPAGTNGLRVRIWDALPAANNSYFEIAEAQLEIGSYATGFSRAAGAYQQELAACQRYFQRYYGGVGCSLSGVGNSATNIWMSFSFPTQLRSSTPTFSCAGNINVSDQYVADQTTASITAASITANAFGGRANFGGFSGITVGRFYSAPSGTIGSGYLQVDAELL